MLKRSLLAAPLAALALAGPAAAAPTPSYDIDVAAQLSGTAAGSDDGWTSSSKFSAAFNQQHRGLAGVADGRSDETIEGDAAAPPLVTMTSLDQQYALETALGTYTWTCAPSAQAAGGAGSIQVMRLGDKGSLYGFVVGDKVTQARDCTGFSSGSDTIDISKGPVTIPPTDFSWAELVKNGSVTVPIDRMVDCGEWTIFQVACSLRLTGVAEIRRTMVDTPEPEETPQPEPTPTGYQPAETGDEITSPPRPMTPIRPKGKFVKDGKAVKVNVGCSGPCAGKVAVKAGSKSLGAKRFSETTRPVTVIIGKGGRATARRKGSVIINVTAGGQSSSFKMRAR